MKRRTPMRGGRSTNNCTPSLVFLLAVMFFGCSRSSSTREENKHAGSDTTTVGLRYAKGFTVRQEGKRKWVEVLKPYQGATTGYKYLLLPREEELPELAPDVKVIRIPINRMVCTSTSHIPLLDHLGEGNKLVGFPGTDYISSENISARVDSGKVMNLGVDKSMNLEQLASLEPDMVMGYSMSSDYGQFKKIEEIGVPVVINAEYLEKHPLGRAEWIKFMALFFDKEQMADSIFSAIEEQYLDAKKRMDTVAHRPTVLSGIVYGDAWFMPGGQNYQAQLLRDAGCEYLWSNNPSSGFLELSFEAVYEKANNADLWIGVGSIGSLKALTDADQRYGRFRPVKQKSVYTYDALKGKRGGSVYLEMGYLRPDIILRDLVKISHPSLLPDHELYFHRRLE